LICPGCGGGKLRPEYASVFLSSSEHEHNLHSLSLMPLAELHGILRELEQRLTRKGEDPTLDEGTKEIVIPSLHTSLRRLIFLLQVGLGYIHLDRSAGTLSAGEAQRIRLAGLLGSGLVSLTVLLDEPSRGLHPSEVGALVDVLCALRDEGNTVVVVEHDPEVIAAADELIDVGPGPGVLGGEIVAQGPPDEVAQQDTITARWLRGDRCLRRRERRTAQDWMTIRGARAHNLRDVTVRFPLGTLVGLCGVSGSGKSTLLVDTIGRALAPKKQTTSVAYENVDPGEHDAIEGVPGRVILVDQTKKGVHSPANFMGLSQPIHEVYAQGEDARALGVDAKALGQRCSVCRGSGSERVDMGFLPDVHTDCEVCRGTGYGLEVWQVRYHGVSLPELTSMTVDQVFELFRSRVPLKSRLMRALASAREVGLGYLVLRQPGYALSGGEAQRLKIAKELCRPSGERKTLYILDEPTVGQHLEDVARLCGVLDRLVDDRHTVLVSEHHPHLLVACDWLIELGPGGGPDGGRVVAEGTPEGVACGNSPMAPHLAALLEGMT
jgi:excinuclease ABC subunit A